MINYNLEILKNKDHLAIRASELIISIINSELAKKSRIQIALSGGSTPSVVYQLLSKAEISWNKVDVFLGDERWVGLDQESSNSLMIRKTLLSNTPGSQACFHVVPTTELLTPESSAEYFESLLEQKCQGSPPIFDLILLGLGDDGHTASLFPYTKSLEVLDKWTTVSLGNGQKRITLTSPVISASRNVLFLVSGSSKKQALKRLLDPDESSERTPAKLIKPSSKISVLVDEDAAVLI